MQCETAEIPGAPLECRYSVPPALLAPFDARRKAALEAAVTQEQRKHLTIAASNVPPRRHAHIAPTASARIPRKARR
jgi:hypothetical protein